jgi:hypothetical protein
VFSNMYSEVQHISQMNKSVNQIMKDLPTGRWEHTPDLLYETDDINY